MNWTVTSLELKSFYDAIWKSCFGMRYFYCFWSRVKKRVLNHGVSLKLFFHLPFFDFFSPPWNSFLPWPPSLPPFSDECDVSLALNILWTYMCVRCMVCNVYTHPCVYALFTAPIELFGDIHSILVSFIALPPDPLSFFPLNLLPAPKPLSS